MALALRLHYEMDGTSDVATPGVRAGSPSARCFYCSNWNRAVVCMMSACIWYGSMRDRCDSWQVSTMKVNEVVRNKEDREAMKASACDQCNQFYASVLLCCLFTPSTSCSLVMFRPAHFYLTFTRHSLPTCLQPLRPPLQQILQEQISYSLLHPLPPAFLQHTLTRPSQTSDTPIRQHT